ncbi:type II 3-dehydroquinate dehydratase [Candidatus Tremblaya phenacola]|uniref:type II 3-dehydroquinate dehydratase n=1 Tax=Candidatus Tremblayella phenacoccinincola TaxID=1010676 RepID=UPI0013301EB6|nr:type II 3-dehydroquinate dehydratase [Candidatus Tremblaya phenacola]KAH0998293.1 3-dehydroquinate dehydratase II [Candidatus Tremblaya phenacola]
MIKTTRILFLNGVNLNMLGIRETDKYGYITISSIIADITELYLPAGIEIEYFQTNSEYLLTDYVHQTYRYIDYMVINPAGHTHTSIAIRDSLLAVNMSFIELHISNIAAREAFRHRSYFSDIATDVLVGFGFKAYYLVIKTIYRSFII